jgi:hypothetical protein
MSVLRVALHYLLGVDAVAAANQYKIDNIGAKVESPNENGQSLAEPKMMLVDATAPILSWTQQMLLWLNSLTLPAIIVAAIKGTRWFTQKEEGIKSTVADFKADLTLIKDNHLHTMQESLKEIKLGQDKSIEEMTRNTKEVVAATNASKDAIVNAILLAKQ